MEWKDYSLIEKIGLIVVSFILLIVLCGIGVHMVKNFEFFSAIAVTFPSIIIYSIRLLFSSEDDR